MEPPRKIDTEMSTFEDRLSALKAALAAAPARSAFRDADYAEMRALLLDHPIARAVQRVFDGGLRNLTDERALPASARPDAAELATAERQMAWARAALAAAPALGALSDAAYADLRAFLLEFPLLHAFRRVLDAAVRNLADERNDATEYALPINIV